MSSVGSSGGGLLSLSDYMTMNTNLMTDSTSTDSSGPPHERLATILRSDRDSKINPRLLGIFASCGLAIFLVARLLWNFGDHWDTVAAAPQPTELPYTYTRFDDLGDDAPMMLPSQDGPDLHATIEALIVALTPTPTDTPTPTPHIEYVEAVVTVEVTRVVDRWHASPTLAPVIETREVYLQPTPTPTMAPGLLRICLYGEGLTGLYVNDVGRAGNTCQDYVLGSAPVVDFSIRATK